MCRNTQDCEKVMEKGWKNRSVGATLMNADSSRSHSIFTIHLERSDHDDKGEEHIRAAKLNLVDLAGSERQAKTGGYIRASRFATSVRMEHHLELAFVFRVDLPCIIFDIFVFN